MEQFVSPKYLMQLVTKVHNALNNEFNSQFEIERYILKWHKSIPSKHPYGSSFNFNVIYENYSDGEMDILITLHNMDSDLLLQIAVDLGLETPDFIPSVATFRNVIKSDYKTASATFEKATRMLEQDPSTAVALANSALESIIKEILKNKTVLRLLPDSNPKSIEKSTLFELTSKILKVFNLHPMKGMPTEFNTIGSSMLSMNQAIETIRSTKTHAHGKTDDDYVVDDPIYAYFVVNSVATIGLFLKSYYEKKFKVGPKNDADEIPF